MQILEVARDAYIESGEISMTELAKRAGVGVGTLYRNFPTREALVVAVYEHEITLLAELAPQLVEAHPPVEALRLWFERLAYYGRMKYGVAAVIHGATTEGAERTAWDLIVGAIDALLKAGSATGDIKADIEAADVLWLVTFLWRIPNDPGIENQTARMLDIVIAGLRSVE